MIPKNELPCSDRKVEFWAVVHICAFKMQVMGTGQEHLEGMVSPRECLTDSQTTGQIPVLKQISPDAEFVGSCCVLRLAAGEDA